MGACRRPLQESFAPTVLAPVRLAAINVRPPPPNVIIGVTNLTLHQVSRCHHMPRNRLKVV